jgi:uncharacterized protein (DUF305 family)
MTMTKYLIAVLLALTTSFTLAACSDDGEPDGDDTSAEVADGEEFNSADVEFATDMIQHHAQALSMVDLTVGRDVSPELVELMEQIRMDQSMEIETMVDWLTDWDQPVPETVRDHANAHGDGQMEMDSDMPGVMSAEEMDRLEAAQGPEFEQLWLEMMIEHHEGAIAMAATENTEGEYPAALGLAETIVGAQEAEIEQMKAMLGS